LAALSGRRRLGFDKTRELSWLFVNERLPAYDPDRHALDRYLDVARHLGAEPVSGWAWPENPAAGKNAEALLAPAAGSGRRRVAVNPGAKWPTKLWPKDAWIDLVRRLDIEGFQVVVTGGPDERDHNRALAEAAPGVLDLTGRTGLKVLAEVYRRVDLIVSPDTGPMHLGAAVGTPVVALFGPTSAQRTGPYGPDHTVISLNVDCRPCFLKNCPDPRCMTDITPQAVMAAVRNRMER
jgi:ADP-heptose:LPS heptosyltransferase